MAQPRNLDKTCLAEPALYLVRRMNSVLMRRVPIESIQNVILDAKAIRWEGEDPADRGNEGVLQSRLGPRDEPSTPCIEPPIWNSIDKSHPALPNNIVTLTRVDPDRDYAAGLQERDELREVSSSVWCMVQHTD